MRFVRWFVCVALFCVDVHVRAEELSSCWDKRMPCPVKAGDTRRVIEGTGLHLTLAPGSLAEQKDVDIIQLVLGSFYVEVSRPIQFKTPYGKFWCADECKALFERDAKEVTVKSLAGRWRIERTGETKTYAIAPGLQVLIGEVDPEGHAAMEFPQSLPWLSTVKSWAALYPGDSKKLRKEIEAFRDVWKEAVEAVSHLHQETAGREIAAFDEGQANEAARQKAREREDESLRHMFREKNNLNQ